MKTYITFSDEILSLVNVEDKDDEMRRQREIAWLRFMTVLVCTNVVLLNQCRPHMLRTPTSSHRQDPYPQLVLRREYFFAADK